MDRGSILRVWLPLLLGLLSIYVIFTGGHGPRSVARWIGLGVSLIGIGGIMLARYELGRSFSIRAKATELVTSGIYSQIRNPIYVFDAIFILGLMLIMRRPRSGCFWSSLFRCRSCARAAKAASWKKSLAMRIANTVTGPGFRAR